MAVHDCGHRELPPRDAWFEAMLNPSRPWLFGPARDLLMGCGVGYFGVFLLLSTAGDEMRQMLPLGLLPLGAVALALPHYGATLVRVYESRDDRGAYMFWAFYFTAALVAAFALGTRVALVGSLLITLYLSWSPWHYSGQNFGVAMMFLRRGGVGVSEHARRLLHWSFILSCALMVLSVHAFPPWQGTDPIFGRGFDFIALPIPAPLFEVLFPVVATAWLASAVGAVVLLCRAAPLALLTPTLTLIALQSLWFGLPALALQLPQLASIEPLGRGHAAYAVLWIALGHCVQYLWITAYHAERRDGRSYTGFLIRALFAGALVWTVPALVFAPGVLGELPFDAGLGMLVASCVNLHHFVMDGVIWKLRTNRVASVLVEGGDGSAPVRHAARRWAFPALVTAGSIAVAINVMGVVEAHYSDQAVQSGDAAALETSHSRLTWIGRDGPGAHYFLGDILLKAGDEEGAEREFRRAVERHPTPAGLTGLGFVLARRGEFATALEPLEVAVELAPDYAEALRHAGVVHLRLGHFERAVDLLERADAVHPRSTEILDPLNEALAELGRPLRPALDPAQDRPLGQPVGLPLNPYRPYRPLD